MIAFDFLNDVAGFAISEGPWATGGQAPYWQVFLAGAVNTLKVALPAAVVAVLWGIVLGLPASPGFVQFARLWVVIFRNTPLLLLLLAVYFVLLHGLPHGQTPWALPMGMMLSKSGLALPGLVHGAWVRPSVGAFTVQAPVVLSPEYLTVLLGLFLYASAYVAEAVRGGVLSVPKGLHQAGLALGLSSGDVKRHVVAPLALRVAWPGIGNALVGLAKNASLGVAVGYPELVSVSNTTMNQTGRVTECVLVMLVLYALMSFVVGRVVLHIDRRLNQSSKPNAAVGQG